MVRFTICVPVKWCGFDGYFVVFRRDFRRDRTEAILLRARMLGF